MTLVLSTPETSIENFVWSKENILQEELEAVVRQHLEKALSRSLNRFVDLMDCYNLVMANYVRDVYDIETDKASRLDLFPQDYTPTLPTEAEIAAHNARCAEFPDNMARLEEAWRRSVLANAPHMKFKQIGT